MHEALHISGMPRRGLANHATAGLGRVGPVKANTPLSHREGGSLPAAVLGMPRPGGARRGAARFGLARQTHGALETERRSSPGPAGAGHGLARLDEAGQGKHTTLSRERRSLLGHGSACQGRAGQGPAGRGTANTRRFGNRASQFAKAGHGRAGRGKAWPGSARQTHGAFTRASQFAE